MYNFSNDIADADSNSRLRAFDLKGNFVFCGYREDSKAFVSIGYTYYIRVYKITFYVYLFEAIIVDA